MIGTNIGSYEILEEIGKGGMATVYRAHQATVDRDVAIKVINRSILHDGNALARFQREARLIARLEHPHILPVYDFDGTHEPPYIVMRYLDGGTLKDIIKLGGFPHADIAAIFRQIGNALDYAHRNGIVHRDIKPSNIMVDRDGNIFVADFGIARLVQDSTLPKGSTDTLTETGVLVGTPHYISPEQIGGSPNIDHRADIYALGVMAFEILTGQLPYQSETAVETIYHHLHSPIPSICALNSSLPLEMEMVIERSMAKKPNERYQSALDLANEFTSALNNPITSDPRTMRLAIAEAKRIRVEAQTKVEQDPDSQQSTPSEANKLVTALNLQVAEYAQLIDERSGAEAARQTITALWKELEALITRHDGKVISTTEDTLLALWGTEMAREDAPEQAIRMALEIHAILRNRAFVEPDELLPINIGIHTGIALLTPASDSSYTASGATISITSRLAQQAFGLILVSHDTFRTVRGVFDFEVDAPVKMRGHKDDLATYRVTALKAQAFRTATRGVEGIETKLTGRAAELELLQNAFSDMLEYSETQVITIISEAGLGKSRLLYEFSQWTDLHPTRFWYFAARATQATTERPYALLRDLIAHRFEILDNDAQDVVQTKMEIGVAGLLGYEDSETAHMIGQLVGFDFSESPHVKGLFGDTPQLTQRAKQLFKRLIVTMSQQQPVEMELEDIHWADDPSLDLLSNLVTENPAIALMIVCLARPSFEERRPTWGSGQDFHTRLELRPLDKRNSRQLAREILQKMPDVPRNLLDLLVERGEGNPYFMEELVKMLIDDKVIQKGEDVWTVEESRLEKIAVPTTLMGLLQTRLDSLFYSERLVLQRGSVMGRIFFDTLVNALDGLDDSHLEDVPALLKKLVEREFIRERETTSFAGSTEYVFAQSMMRDLVYESLLKRHQRAYHAGIADWLVQSSGDRVAEFYPLIAEHYEKGEQRAKAASYLIEAGLKSIYVSAYREAGTFFERALALDPSVETTARLYLGDADMRLGEFSTAQKNLEAALQLARQQNDSLVQAKVLATLSDMMIRQGNYAQAQVWLDEVIALAPDDPKTRAMVLFNLGYFHWKRGAFEEAVATDTEFLQLTQESGLVWEEVRALGRVGVDYLGIGKPDKALIYLEQCYEKSVASGNRAQAATAMNNIGNIWADLKGMAYAKPYIERALALNVELERLDAVALVSANLADFELRLGNTAAAIPALIKALTISKQLGIWPETLQGVIYFARLLWMQGRTPEALPLLGLALYHPATDSENIREARELLEEIGVDENAARVEIEAGKALDLESVAQQLLDEFGGQ